MSRGQGHARVAGMEGGQGCGQVERSEGLSSAEGDPPAQHGGQLVQLAAGGVQFTEHPLSGGQEQLADG